MKYPLLTALVSAVVWTAVAAPAAFATASAPRAAFAKASAPKARETARVMYTRALAEERTVRDDSSNPTLAAMRHVIASYEAIVRQHPTSGYCDNALWQAANVAMLAYERFGNDADKKAASRLFARLIKEYPTSKLVSGAREALAAAPVPAPTAGSDLDVRRTPEPVAITPPDAPARHRVEPASVSAPPAEGKKSRSDPGLTTLKDVRRTALPDGVRVMVDLDAEVPYHQEEIANPRRLFFDLKGVKAAPNLQDVTLRFEDDVVKEIRLGRHPQNTTRLVVDLDGIVGYSVYPLYSPYRLVIDLQRASSAPGALTHAPSVWDAPSPTRPAANAHAGAAKPFTPPVLPVDTKAPSAAGTAIAEVKPPAPLPIIDTAPELATRTLASDVAPLPSKQALPRSAPPLAPAANSNGKFSLSRQLGLGVSRIVIDAGHGGHDPGARGNGINEAELTLDVAQRLQKLLDAQPGFDVVMTRDTDEFVPLQERTAIANREGADLFLSIHANASRNIQARGIETYFLNFAMNPEAEAVAARENAASGQSMHSLPDIVKAIALNNKINESRDFATTVQRSMTKRLGSKNKSLRDLGVKQAPFVVLIGASMPSVLAEISFVTNKQDSALLKTQNYRQQIAQALFDAIQNYQQGLTRMNSVAGKKATTQ
jgi:N-acetylmuramoyl-L-alanine amidase